MNGIHKNTSLIYHRIGGLIETVHWKTRVIDVLCFCHLNDLRNIIGKEGIINIHKQLLLAILSQHIPHVNNMLRVAFRCGTGI